MHQQAARPENKDTDVVLVGFGAAGRAHAKALNTAGSPNLRGVLEPNPSVRLPQDVRRYASWHQVLRDPSVDLISFCTPPGGRHATVKEALLADKAVLLETPPVGSVAELDEMIGLSESVRRPVAVMLPHLMQLPEQLLDWSWGPGATALLQVSDYRPAEHFRSSSWRMDPTQALGGITAHAAVHHLDLVCRLLGEPASLHLAGLRELRRGIDLRVAGTVEFTAGATLSFAVTAEAAAMERLVVVDTGKTVTFENGRIETDQDGVLSEVPARPLTALHAAVYRELAETLRTAHGSPRCGLASYRPTASLLDSLRRELAWYP